MAKHVVVYGNPIDGIFIVGPFKTGEDARHYGETERDPQNWWIAPLHSPASWGEEAEMPLSDAAILAMRAEVQS